MTTSYTSASDDQRRASRATQTASTGSQHQRQAEEWDEQASGAHGWFATATLVRAAAERLIRYPHQVWHYGDSVGFEGLLAASDLLQDSAFDRFAYGVVKGWVPRADPFIELDITVPGRVLVDLARRYDDEGILETARRLANNLITRRRLRGALVSFENAPLLAPYGDAALSGEAEQLLRNPGAGVFVDCLHFVPPFLVDLGREVEDQELVDLGAAEALAMVRLLREPDGSLAHFYLERTGERYGQHWGRGQGWALLGLLDVLEGLGDHSSRDELEASVRGMLSVLRRTQRSDGSWGTPMDDPASASESSTAAFVAAGVPRAARLGLAGGGDLEMAGQAWEVTRAHVFPDGRMSGVSSAVWASTELSHYRHVPRGAQVPWGLGIFLLAAAEQMQVPDASQAKPVASSQDSVTRLEVRHLRAPGANPAVFDGSFETTLVLAETADGTVGIGEAESAPAAVRAIVEGPGVHAHARSLEDLVIGGDAHDPEGAFARMHLGTEYVGRRGLAVHAIGATDIALWDLRGKLEGAPVWALLGDRHHDRIPVYASSYPTPTDPARLAEWLHRIRQVGFRSAKIFVEPWWLTEPDRARALLGKARSMLADGTLLVDGALVTRTVEEARRLAYLLVEAGVDIFEAPLPLDEVEGHREISRIGVPLGVGDLGLTDVREWRDFLTLGAGDVLQPDPSVVGGVTGLRAVADLADARGARLVPHGYRSRVTLAAGLHVLASRPGPALIEYCLSDSALLRDLLNEPFAVGSDGCVAVPDRPGLGVTLRPGALDEFAVR